MSAASSSSVAASDLPLVISGAGLAGCMSALLLAQQYAARGIKQRIVVLEHREDFRKEERQDAEGGRIANAVKRSINLALSHRGMSALKAAGLSAGNSEIIPMKNRLMHSLAGEITAQAYGVGDQAIYSISRRGLNEMLLNELDALGPAKVSVIYNAKVLGVKQDGTVTYSSGERGAKEQTIKALLVIGADGAYSKVRDEMRRFTRMDFSMQYIKHGYKELTIPAAADKDGKPCYAMTPWQGLHIWPRDQFMLIALPNPDFSFTCTLFFPFEGPESLEGIETDAQIVAYFERYFPDVIPVMPDLIADYRASPISALLQVRCDPYHAPGNRVCILGDAAHACVPFYGQGQFSSDCHHSARLTPSHLLMWICRCLSVAVHRNERRFRGLPALLRDHARMRHGRPARAAGVLASSRGCRSGPGGSVLPELHRDAPPHRELAVPHAEEARGGDPSSLPGVDPTVHDGRVHQDPVS